jgi:hypothetical protein
MDMKLVGIFVLGAVAGGAFSVTTLFFVQDAQARETGTTEVDELQDIEEKLEHVEGIEDQLEGIKDAIEEIND